MQLNKRDYFAAQALTGILARDAGAKEGTDSYAAAAAEAYEYADAMLKLSKTLRDPVEFDPDKDANEEEADQLRKKQNRLKGRRHHLSPTRSPRGGEGEEALSVTLRLPSLMISPLKIRDAQWKY